MEDIFAAVGDGRAPGDPYGGTGGGHAQGAGVGVQLRARRQLLLQLDARLRRREAMATTMLAAEAFGPAVAALRALEGYLSVAKASPHAHGLGSNDIHLALAFMGNCFEQRLWAQGQAVLSRAVALYVATYQAFKTGPDDNSDWTPTFQVAALPAYGTKRAQTMMSCELLGSVNLLEGEELTRAVELLRLHESGPTQNLGPLLAPTCHFQHGEIAPSGYTRRVCTLNRALMVVAAALGANRTHGSGPRGRAARAALMLGKGKGKGKGNLGLEDLAAGMGEDV